MIPPLKVAVAGLGTVGGAVVKTLAHRPDLLAERCGRRIELTAVSARDRGRDRGLDLSGPAWFDEPVRMAHETDAEVFVELIGGEDGPARAACEAALAAGRDVVTANKALIARHGATLARQAGAAGRTLAYEAAVAGGIPIVKALREGLTANHLSAVYGILNGTCNYVLTEMGETGRAFEEVLADAQALGYAEADPSFDVDGVDTAHKLAILTALAFGGEVDFNDVHVEGIRHVSADDIAFADELGYRIKLLGIARGMPDGIEQRVHPCMVAKHQPIARVDGVYNAVVVHGDKAGSTLLVGQGAGAGPTASAVVADIADIARGNRLPVFAVTACGRGRPASAPMERHRGAYYLRLMVRDRPGVIADVAAALRDHDISMESMIQRGRDPGEPVPVVITTHETQEAAMMRALERIAALESIVRLPCMIRIESL